MTQELTASKRPIFNIKPKPSTDRDLSEFLGTYNKLVIPNKYVAPYLKEVVSKWETGSYAIKKLKSPLGKEYNYIPQKEYDPVQMMAENLRMGSQKLREILSGEGHSIFKLIDRIFTELDLTHLWYEDENLALAYSMINKTHH